MQYTGVPCGLPTASLKLNDSLNTTSAPRLNDTFGSGAWVCGALGRLDPGPGASNLEVISGLLGDHEELALLVLVLK